MTHKKKIERIIHALTQLRDEVENYPETKETSSQVDNAITIIVEKNIKGDDSSVCLFPHGIEYWPRDNYIIPF